MPDEKSAAIYEDPTALGAVRTLAEARAAGDGWMHDYNTTHSHSSLGYQTSEEFLGLYETTPPPQKSLAA